MKGKKEYTSQPCVHYLKTTSDQEDIWLNASVKGKDTKYIMLFVNLFYKLTFEQPLTCSLQDMQLAAMK